MTGVPFACRPYRATLEALVEHGERGLLTPAALDHLGVCAACERDLTSLALTVAALRRAGREVQRAPVPAPSRARLAALAAPRGTPWPWRLQLGGLLTGAAIAALVVLPGTGRPTSWTGDAVEPARTVVATWRMAEVRLATGPDTPSFSAPGAVPPRYPEGRLRPWKEVPASDAGRRGFTAY
jgi:anti-sigma factor RsiW